MKLTLGIPTITVEIEPSATEVAMRERELEIEAERSRVLAQALAQAVPVIGSLVDAFARRNGNGNGHRAGIDLQDALAIGTLAQAVGTVVQEAQEQGADAIAISVIGERLDPRPADDHLLAVCAALVRGGLLAVAGDPVEQLTLDVLVRLPDPPPPAAEAPAAQEEDGGRDA